MNVDDFDAGFDAALDQLDHAVDEALADPKVDDEGNYECESHHRLVKLSNLIDSLRIR